LPEITDQSLGEEILDLLSNQAVLTPIWVLASMGLVAYMAADAVSIWYWGGWLAAVFLGQVLRVLLFLRLPQEHERPLRARLRTAALMNATSTGLHSLSLCFFPILSPFEGAVQSMMLMGMGMASIITTAGYRPFALAHILLCLVPLYSMWAWSGLDGPGGTVALCVAIIGAGYAFSLFAFTNRIFNVYRDSFKNRKQLASALAKAEEAGLAKTRFLASASHDLRQPIHTLSLFSGALGMRELDERTTHIAQSIDSAVQTLAYQLDALLDISKLDAGIVTVRDSSFNLHNMLHRLREEVLPVAEDRGINLLLECPGEAIVTTDTTLLERIFRNLLTNAVHHNEKCAVQLRVARQGDNWHCTVADTGRGIPAEEQDKIFEEFYQLENPERDRSKGLGLGLAIVQRLAVLLKLQMNFESRPGWGTEFQLTIKAADEEREFTSGPQMLISSLESLCVLVVDDESAVRDGMKVLLEILGCQVYTADGSNTAIAMATSLKPDLALVDFRLRNHDTGLATIKRLRALYPSLPAIIISGDTAPDRLQQARTAGVPVLTKPVLIEPLKEAIALACHLREEDAETPTDQL
jgi:signal transduction histidine kinase/CheY-like chemotaxis protein